MALAGNNQIRILEDKEILEGVLPMLIGHTVENVPSADRIKVAGYYLWSDDKHDKIIKELKSLCRFNLLLEKPIGHDRKIRMAYIYPGMALNKS